MTEPARVVFSLFYRKPLCIHIALDDALVPEFVYPVLLCGTRPPRRGRAGAAARVRSLLVYAPPACASADPFRDCLPLAPSYALPPHVRELFRQLCFSQ